MERISNSSRVNEIVLHGFPNLQRFHVLLFSLLLIIYLFIISGNAIMLFVICRESALHSPMYFFIAALSCLEICYTAITIPKMLADLLEDEKKISFNGCLVQAYFLHALGTAECFILTVMAYDRYLAICKPLRYSSIMTTDLYVKLVATCFIGGILRPVIETVLISLLTFCGLNLIENVFCDFPPLISLACTDTRLYIMVEFLISIFGILLTSAFILFSCIRIIYIILKVKSKDGRQKAFSTCGAHLIVVTMFFSSIGFMYIRVTKSYSVEYDRAVGLTYAVFTPLANPIIYGLRNQEIKKFLQKYLVTEHFLCLLQHNVCSRIVVKIQK
ncbi:olfactory receptor 6N1-like [Bufo gargarizans]|uniref:olfactory receptor 6N1-like n=1 Tax=Bufo gargarizans TaxID=30331 RepID=UPI001CF1F154|nr:olfactory receptor 6N1-like [Bufo gargarizans]